MRPSRRLGFMPAVCCRGGRAACWSLARSGGDDSLPGGGRHLHRRRAGLATTDASCNVPLLCTRRGGYDGTDGNPPGLSRRTRRSRSTWSTLFKSTVTLHSPDFTVGAAPATAPCTSTGSSPPARWSTWRRRPPTRSTLLDRTDRDQIGAADGEPDQRPGLHRQRPRGQRQSGPHLRDLDHGRDQLDGRRHRLLSGTTSVRFDNVSLSVDSPAGGGGNGRRRRPHQLAARDADPGRQPDRSGDPQRGNRVTVKAKLPGQGRSRLPDLAAGPAEQAQAGNHPAQRQGGQGQDAASSSSR